MVDSVRDRDIRNFSVCLLSISNLIKNKLRINIPVRNYRPDDSMFQSILSNYLNLNVLFKFFYPDLNLLSFCKRVLAILEMKNLFGINRWCLAVSRKLYEYLNFLS